MEKNLILRRKKLHIKNEKRDLRDKKDPRDRPSVSLVHSVH